VAAVLVTGGAGFIGSHLVEALVRRGDRVRVLDDFSTGTRENLAGLDVEIVRGDIRDRSAAAAALAGVQTLYHLAAAVSVPESLADPRRCYEVNLLGTLTLLEAGRASGVERAVLASSCAVYGDGEGPAVEDAPARPLSPYADSKLAMEGVARLYSRTHGPPSVCLRFFNVYGPRQSPLSEYAAVIPRFIRALVDGDRLEIHGDGRQTRDFVFIGDAVAAILRAADPAVPPGEVFNVGTGASISILELAQSLQRLFPEAPPPIHGAARPGDVRSSRADPTRSRRVLGYEPAVGLPEGLQATVEWARRSWTPVRR